MSNLPISLFNFPLFNSINAGIGQNFSNPIDVNEAISYCVQFSWTVGSGLIGNIYLQAANDRFVSASTIWTTIQQSQLAVSGAADSHMINVEKPAYSWVRLVIDLSAGSLTGNASINGKRG